MPRDIAPGPAGLFLLSVILITFIIALAPLGDSEIWGSDTGEYLTLTSHVVENGRMPDEYHGWGHTYHEFPGMQYLLAVFTLLAGTSNLETMRYLIPLVSGLIVLPVYLISRSLLGRRDVALSAAAILAVSLGHAYPATHAMPGALGGFLATGVTLAFIGAYRHRHPTMLSMRDPHAVVAIVIAAALVVTHHLSLYFLLLGLLGLIIYGVLGGDGIYSSIPGPRGSDLTIEHPEPWYQGMAMFGIIAGITMLFWLTRPVFTGSILEGRIGISPSLMAVLGVMGVALTCILLDRARTFLGKRDIMGSLRRFCSREVSGSMLVKEYLAFQGIAFGFLIVAMFIGVPGSSIRTDPSALYYLAPNLLIMGFVGPGMTMVKGQRGGLMLYLWVALLGTSLIVATVTGSTEILPYRHAQYILIPAAILMGYGAILLIRERPRIFTPLLVLGIVLSVGAFPPTAAVMGGFEEGYSTEELLFSMYAGDAARPINGSDPLLATDHRVSSMTFGIGHVNGTWDYTPVTFHSRDLNDTLEELASVRAPSGRGRADLVAITPSMEAGVALIQWETAEPMPSEVRDKFDQDPFWHLYSARGVDMYLVHPDAWKHI